MNHSHRLNDHYPLLLGLDQHREVERVDLQVAAKQVRSHLQHVLGAALTRPQCQNACGIFDHAPAHESRHLDTLQADPVLRARVPRCQCAVKHSPFT